MIDERINKTLSDMEANLRQVESAKKQVESTVNSFSGLTGTTSQYVNSLSRINKNLDSLVRIVGEDYEKNIQDLNQEKDAILQACNSALESLNSATEDVKENVANSIEELRKKMNYTIIANAVIFVVMLILFFIK